MKKNLILLLSGLMLIGCSGADTGSAIPPPPPKPTAEQIQAMPPQARTAMENAQGSGDYQAQRMREMAAAQRAAGK